MSSEGLIMILKVIIASFVPNVSPTSSWNPPQRHHNLHRHPGSNPPFRLFANSNDSPNSSASHNNISSVVANGTRVNEFTKMTINSLTTDSSKLRHLITRRSPTTETQQLIDRKWSVKPILRPIQIYAGIALRFDRKSDLRRAMKPGPGSSSRALPLHLHLGNCSRVSCFICSLHMPEPVQASPSHNHRYRFHPRFLQDLLISPMFQYPHTHCPLPHPYISCCHTLFIFYWHWPCFAAVKQRQSNYTVCVHAICFF